MPTVQNAAIDTQRNWVIRYAATAGILLLTPFFLVLVVIVELVMRLSIWGGSKD